MLVLDNRSTVVNYIVGITLVQLAVEVFDIRTLSSCGGAELLEHGLERTFLTTIRGPVAIGNVSEQLRCFLTSLTLAEKEESVVGTITIEYSTDRVVIPATDAQTVGQQFHRLDVVADVVNQVGRVGEFPGTIISAGFGINLGGVVVE